MTKDELKALLEELEIPVFYNHTTRKDTVTLPFIVFLDSGNTSVFADNLTYAETTPYTIILHTLERDYTLEGKVKALLTKNHIAYTLNDVDFLEDLLMWQVSFNITVYGG